MHPHAKKQKGMSSGRFFIVHNKAIDFLAKITTVLKKEDRYFLSVADLKMVLKT
jgi:hypothetical protein